MKSTLRLSRVSKSFGSVDAVVEASLQVEPGELLALLGPSGCGKSTVLRLIAGLESPDEGEIHMGGVRWNGVAPRERNVAMVFQDHALYPHRTVRGNIEYPLALRRLSNADRAARVTDVARALHIEHLLDRYPRLLSGGELQRAALARALVREPTCFLLDEPASSLDPQLRLDVRMEVRRLQREVRVPTVYVTHDQEEAVAIGDRIAVMHAGRILQVDTALAILSKPASMTVAAFFGRPPMNLLPAAAVGESGGNVQICVGGTIMAELSTRRWVPNRTNVMIGVRPKDVDIDVTADEHRTDAASVDSIVLNGSVSLVEGVEQDYTVYCETPAGRVCARINRHVVPGNVRLRLAVERLVFFDPETGNRIDERTT